jgi:hypothetical protein
MVTFGYLLMATQAFPKVGQVLQVLIAEALVSTDPQNPSLESEKLVLPLTNTQMSPLLATVQLLELMT